MTALLPSTPVLLAFLGASLATLLVPGPSVVYAVARSLEQGRRAGLYSVLGLETGAVVHVLAATVGLAALIASSESAFAALKIAGAGYLVWLGIKELLAARGRHQIGGAGLAAASPRRLYLDGVLVDLLNPKTALFFLAFLPQFIDPAHAAAPQLAVLGLLFVALAGVVDGAYAMLAVRISRRLNRSPRVQHQLNLATGSVYLALAGVVAIT